MGNRLIIPTGNRLIIPTGKRFAPLWTPRILGGLELWLDASDTNTITEDVGVSQWDDKSGNDNHAVQGIGANQPTYDTDKLVFNGTTQYFDLTSHVPAIDGESTIFVVGYATRDAFIANGVNGGGVYFSALFIDTVTNYATFRVADAEPTLTVTVDINIRNQTRIWTLVKPANNAVSHFSINNGTASSTAATNSVSLDNTRIGALETNSGTLFNLLLGDIYEIVVYNKELTASQRLSVYNYLANKWSAVL